MTSLKKNPVGKFNVWSSRVVAYTPLLIIPLVYDSFDTSCLTVNLAYMDKRSRAFHCNQSMHEHGEGQDMACNGGAQLGLQK